MCDVQIIAEKWPELGPWESTQRTNTTSFSCFTTSQGYYYCVWLHDCADKGGGDAQTTIPPSLCAFFINGFDVACLSGHIYSV